MLANSEHVVVIGLGYVGLPLAVEAALSSLRVTGFDIDESIVENLNQGRSHIGDISNQQVGEALACGFSATNDPSILLDADSVVICVPTPLDEHQAPDLRLVTAATRTVRDHLHQGMLVILESTTYPGTTDGLVRGILEESGLIAGDDFALVFSPERIDPGNPIFRLKNTPKIVGGLTPSCTERAAVFYGQFIDSIVRTTGPREAELAKLLENTYRHVNIALVNEMAIFSNELGIDLWDAINAAASKPFGFSPFYPGPGVGGHCIPVDPNYLSFTVRSIGHRFRFVELAQEISDRMPVYIVGRVQELLNRDSIPLRGSKVLVLGLTYKPNVADDRETPARGVIRALRKGGASVIAHDPYIAEFVVDGLPVELVSNPDEGIALSDVVLLLQQHSSYNLDVIAATANRVFDTRGCMQGDAVERL